MAKHFLAALYMCFCVGILWPAYAAAQKNNEERLQVVIKFAPSVLIEPEGGYQFGFEAPVGKKITWQAEYAYLCYFWDWEEGPWFGGTDVLEQDGYALKSELRYYFYEVSHMNGFYGCLQGQYKYVFSKVMVDQGWDNMGNPIEPYEQRRYKEVAKANLKIGYQWILPGGLALDMYTGAGIRYAWYHIKPRNDDFWMNDSQIPINIALGLKFGYAF